MRGWIVILVVIVSAGMAGTAVAEMNGPFSLEYCPATPAPPNAKGKTQGAVTAKFFPEGREDLRLYLGTGLAYSLPPRKDEYREAGAGLKTGVAGQAGIDYTFSDRTSLNLDYKYLHLAQDAARPGSDEAQSPHLFGLSLRCRF